MSLISLLLLTATQAATPAPVEPAKPVLICKRLAISGSRLGGKRECRTKEDWDAYNRDTESEARTLLDKGTIKTGG